MKRCIGAVGTSGAVAVLLMSMAACASTSNGSSTSAASAGKGTVSIGVLMEETGPLASLAQPQVKAIELAAKKINSSGGINGKTVSLIEKDTASDPATAAAVGRSLIGKTQAVIGTASGAGCRAVQPIFNGAKILQYCQSPQDFDITPYFFYNEAAISSYPDATVPWLRSKGIHKIAFIGQDDATGDANIEIFQEIAKKYPSEFQVVTDQRFTSGATNLETQMTNVRNSNPDLIVAGASGANIVAVVQAVNALGLKQPVYVGSGSASVTALDPVKNSLPAGGLIANAFWVDVPNDVPSKLSYASQIKTFAKAFQASAGTAPSQGEGGAYDSMMQIATAMKSGATTGPKIASYLESHSYTGVLGPYKWSATRHQGASLPTAMMSFGADGAFHLAYSGS